MARVRSLVVVLAVLLLGAWSCPAPSPGAPVATVANGQAEDWHYVGEVGEPAFYDPGSGAAWQNATVGTFNLAFRIREAGVVDIQGAIDSTADPATSDLVFQLPEGYRPSGESYGVAVGYVGAGVVKVPLLVSVATSGFVTIVSGTSNPYSSPGAADSLSKAYLALQIFLEPSTAP